MLKYKRIGVTVKSGLDEKDKAVSDILDILKKLGAETCVDLDRMKDVPSAKDEMGYECEDDVDLILVLGGDGTILRAVRELTSFDTPILSVNRGTIGFLAETSLDEAETLLPKLLSGEGVLEERSILHVIAKRGNKVILDGYALNEAVIAQGTIARLVDLPTKINGEDLSSFHADGLIISTPTGSTAYSLAAGGPIVHPKMSAAILTPISPHSFTQKPVVVPGDNLIELEVQTQSGKFRDTEVMLTLDGQVYVKLEQGDTVSAKINSKTVKFVRRKQDTFFETLRTKMKWGERLEG